MVVGCYTMDLYCRHRNVKHPYGYLPHNFTGETRGECVRQAREIGWHFYHDGEVSCPLCARQPQRQGGARE